MSISPNNRWLAFGVDTVSRRVYEVHFKNLDTGDVLDVTIQNSTGGVAWANDNKTVFYTSKNETTLLGEKIWRHKIGINDSDEMVYHETDETFYNVKFRLYEVLEGGTPFWEESQLIFIKDGFLTATIGVSNELNYIPPAAFLEVEVGSSVLEPRQEMTSVFYSILSDTAYYAKGYTKTEDLSSVALSGKYEDLLNMPDTL